MSPSAPPPSPRACARSRTRTRALRFVAALTITTSALLLHPAPIAGDTLSHDTLAHGTLAHGTLSHSTWRWRLTYARSTAALLELLRHDPPQGDASIRLSRSTRLTPPCSRSRPAGGPEHSRSGLTAHRSLHRSSLDARLTAATHRSITNPDVFPHDPRRLLLDCSAAAGPYPPALDLGCLPRIEPPGLQTPAVRGVSAYLDLEIDLTEDPLAARGWSAGFAIDF